MFIYKKYLNKLRASTTTTKVKEKIFILNNKEK